jgi:hypothetical protein
MSIYFGKFALKVFDVGYKAIQSNIHEQPEIGSLLAIPAQLWGGTDRHFRR